MMLMMPGAGAGGGAPRPCKFLFLRKKDLVYLIEAFIQARQPGSTAADNLLQSCHTDLSPLL